MVVAFLPAIRSLASSTGDLFPGETGFSPQDRHLLLRIPDSLFGRATTSPSDGAPASGTLGPVSSPDLRRYAPGGLRAGPGSWALSSVGGAAIILAGFVWKSRREDVCLRVNSVGRLNSTVAPRDYSHCVSRNLFVPMWLEPGGFKFSSAGFAFRSLLAL